MRNLKITAILKPRAREIAQKEQQTSLRTIIITYCCQYGSNHVTLEIDVPGSNSFLGSHFLFFLDVCQNVGIPTLHVFSHTTTHAFVYNDIIFPMTGLYSYYLHVNDHKYFKRATHLCMQGLWQDSRRQQDIFIH